MSALSVEERLTRLERALKTIEDRLASPANGSRWRETVGMFRNDPIFKEIADAGREIRRADRDES